MTDHVAKLYLPGLGPDARYGAKLSPALGQSVGLALM
jgi:hypothetical protein